VKEQMSDPIVSFYKLVKAMRAAQREYYRTHTQLAAMSGAEMKG